MELVNFTCKFFESMGCKVSGDKDMLKIENVPDSFEKLYKKEPYYIVFDQKNLNEDRILMKQGEELFNLITDSLKKSSSTTLLKIDFNVNPGEIIGKNFTFNNCRISKIKQTNEKNFFYRFIFHTNFTYLNKKEQVINEIYVHNGEIVNGDLEGYPIEEGRKEDVSTKEIEKNYGIAKDKIKELIKCKIEQISEKLESRLTKGIERIQGYYDSNLREVEEKIKNEEERIIHLKEKFGKLDNEGILEKIKRSESNIEKIKKDFDLERIKKEQLAAINDEKHKHSLNVDNNLLNTTVIYYPIFKFNLTFDNNLGKSMNISYNPLTGKTEVVKCSICEKEIKQINMCLSGHVACDDCIGMCGSCKDYFCKECLKKECQYCGAKLCRNCSTNCRKCHKVICKSHVKEDCVTGKFGCDSCLKICSKCKKASDSVNFKKQGNISVCKNCFVKQLGDKINEDIFQSK